MVINANRKTTGEKLRVYLIDDSPIFLHTAVNFLSRDNNLTTLGTAPDAETAIVEVGSLQPDVILLDLAMPGMNGLEVMPLLYEAAPQAKIIILTLLESDNDKQVALSAGAQDFVSKSAMLTDLLPAIWRVAGRV